jgi:hypothetical protein
MQGGDSHLNSLVDEPERETVFMENEKRYRGGVGLVWAEDAMAY